MGSAQWLVVMFKTKSGRECCERQLGKRLVNNYEKENANALDYLCNFIGAVAAGIGHFLHDGRVHSSVADRRRRGGVDPNHSGASANLAFAEWRLTAR